MTKKEAFMTTMRLGVPDMVPVSPLIHSRYAHRVLGRGDWKAVFELHQQIGSTHYRGPIGMGVKFHPVPGYETETEVLLEDGSHKITRTILHTPFGDLTSTHEAGMIPDDPLVGRTTEYYVKEPGQWKAFIKLWNEQAQAAEPAPGQTVEEACRVMGEDGIPSVGLGSVYSALGSHRGMAELLLDLIDEPGLMREVFDARWRVEEVCIEAFIESPSEVCWYDICWATGSNMGPEMFEKWCLDEVIKACHKVRSAGKYISLYTLGKIRKLMDFLVDAGPNMIATFEPNEGDISLAEAKKSYGDRVCLMGNFDCVILARGTLEDAKKEALRCLEEGMESGGFILGTGDEVPADTKYENLKAMVDVVNERGRYE